MTNDDTWVDVVIATNRESPFLVEAIDSVVAQRHPSWRIIIVDDGSPNPGFIRRSAANVANAVVVRQEAAGPSAARNRGVGEGDSPLIAFLDDDDIWTPDRLRLQVAAAAHHPAAVGVFSGFWYLDEHGRRLDGDWPATHTPSAHFIDGSAMLPRIVTLMVRRDVFERLRGFDESYRVCEDNQFTLRLAMEGELIPVPEELVGYRRHGSNTSTGHPLERAETNRMLTEFKAEATRRGDERTRRLFEENLRQYRRAAGEATVFALSEASRARDWATVRRELRWGFSQVPASTLAAGLRRAGAKLRPSGPLPPSRR
jgi:glycosyltransferase involved in cell wall biosynthesis